MDKKKQLIAWLNDAYGLETSLIEVLERHVEDAKDSPDVATKIQEHLDKTKGHADMISKCLKKLDNETSVVKETLSASLGAMKGMSADMFDDKAVKNAISDFTAEHMEIASYTALIAAAEELGESEIAETCMAILRDEEEMASWLKEQLPMITKKYLNAEV